jgi:hypothetical protein
LKGTPKRSHLQISYLNSNWARRDLSVSVGVSLSGILKYRTYEDQQKFDAWLNTCLRSPVNGSIP